MNKQEEMLKSWNHWQSGVNPSLIPEMHPSYARGFSEGWDLAHSDFPDLQFVIDWLENGCDPRVAAKELTIYKKRLEKNE